MNIRALLKFKQLLNIICLILFFNSCTLGQIQEEYVPEKKSFISDYTYSFISIDNSRIALVNAKLIDGTGVAPKKNQTVLIENGIISKVGYADEIKIPKDYYYIDLSNKTLIPGIVGTHNHMRLPQFSFFWCQ